MNDEGYPLEPRPLLVLGLVGDQLAMGAQHGRLVRHHGGHEGVADFYRDMPARTIAQADPRPLARALVAAGRPALDAALGHLERARPPALRARTRGFFRALGLPARHDRHLMAVDLLQNTVGLAGRWGLTGSARAVASAMPGACSSVAVWGASSDDGRLLHARNFDLPGIGVWDRVPAVVFCAPERGLRYGFVTARGADVPAVTAFNEAGVTITPHTRFHRDVCFRGAAIVDLAHEVARRASTLAEAVAIVGERRVASSWGLMVSSARERRAIVIEVTARRHAVVEPADDEAWLAETNRYRSAGLAAGELVPSVEWARYSDGRAAVLSRAMRGRRGWSVDALEGLLGSFESPDVPGWDRATGAVLAQSISIQSVVSDPERRAIHVSVGTAPTGRGPWRTVPWRWDGAPRAEVIAAPPRPPRSGPAERAFDHFMEASRRHAAGASAREVSASLDRALALVPDDPSYLTLGAGTALSRGDRGAARSRLERARVAERSPFRRARIDAWISRLDAGGRIGRVAIDFQQLALH